MCKATLALVLLASAGAAAAQTVLTSGERLSVDVSSTNDELVFNLVGDLWTIAGNGGVASRLAETPYPADRPRWSPDGRQIVYEAAANDGDLIWLLDTESGSHRRLVTGGRAEREPTWHPSGERIAYASRRGGRDFDIWEQDLATGLEWRLTNDSADEREPAWSADGRDLVYVSSRDGRWMLMLRRFAEPPTVLIDSDAPILAPAWRPDGTLISYFRGGGDRFELRMIILADPPLDRVLSSETDLFPSPVAWRDRSRFYYSTDDKLRTRTLDEWIGTTVTFRASLRSSPSQPPFQVAERSLPLISPSTDKLVIRAGRIFDGYSSNYRYAADVLIDGGVIADVTASRDWTDIPVIDLPNTTLLPGFIDAYARLPQARLETRGAGLLAWGITTIVAEVPDGFDAAMWESEDTPGPRLLPATQLTAPPEAPAGPDSRLPHLVVAGRGAVRGDSAVAACRQWQSMGIPVLAEDWSQSNRLNTYLLAAAQAPVPLAASAPRSGFRRQVIDLSTRQLVSGLAHRHTTGIADLFDARQALETARRVPLRDRIPLLDDLRRSRTPVVLSSAPNRLPPGLALHAELLAFKDEGLAGDRALQAAGRNAAALLGVSGQIGEISVGARADLVLVDGDPVRNPSDARRIVAVIRNGRFYSLVALLERASSTVE